MSNISSFCCVAFLLTLFTGEALAHALWRPDGLVPPRNNRDDLKVGPCGNVARTDQPTYLKSGSTIVVEMESVIFHEGYYRISFSPANDQGFEQFILADDIPDIKDQKYYSQSITLPDIECDDCTLQLIQVMLDREPPTNYYSCADIVLTETGLPEPSPSDTTAPSDIEFTETQLNANSASLTWNNPPDSDLFRVLITRADSANTGFPQIATDYEVGDALGNAEVVFNALGTAFTDNNLRPSSEYFYKAYAYDDSLNYSQGAEIQIATGSENSAPLVSLAAEQNFRITQTLQRDAGPVVIQATVNDVDSSDTHRYDWSASDSALVDTDVADAVLTFDPVSLDSRTYTARVTVTDNGNPPLSSSAQITMTLAPDSPPVETPSEPTPEPTQEPEPQSDSPENANPEADETESSSSGAGASDIQYLALLLLLVLIRRFRL